ncbi:hypothetical protein GCM10020254_38740 [Streptomyces goshikiensis]
MLGRRVPAGAPGPSGAAVVDLDPDDALEAEQPQPVAPAGRDAVQQGVGGQFAHAEQQVVPARCHTPRVKGHIGELPGRTHRLKTPRIEPVPHQGGLNVQIHLTIVAVRD